MHDKKYVFILNNQGKGAILARPAQFGYPPKIAIPNKIPDAPVSKKEYFNTGRLRYSPEVPTNEAMIYTEKNCRLNLDDYVGKAPEPEVVKHDEPILYGVTITYKEYAYVEVMATDEEEAKEKAYEEMNNGNAQINGDDNFEYEVEEIE